MDERHPRRQPEQPFPGAQALAPGLVAARAALTAAAIAWLALAGRVAAAPTPTPAPVAGDEAWQALLGLRAAWSSVGPEVAAFRQTFTPAGFAAGDTERGEIALALPSTLRWDYREPEAKSFLLLGGEVYSWIPGSADGHRASFDPRREPGLDLLLLPVEALRERYAARLVTATPGRAGAGHGGPTIALEPLSAEAPLRSASLTLSADGRRLQAIRYTDRDGNHTVFDLEGFRPLADPSRLAPPAGVAWSRD